MTKNSEMDEETRAGVAVRKARIRWLSEIEAGRPTPPSGQTFSTVARFLDDVAGWPEVAWSLVLEWSTPPDATGAMVADVKFLSPDAPMSLLQTGAIFELYEGKRCVARGEVMAD